jgi:hypothetical protein
MRTLGGCDVRSAAQLLAVTRAPCCRKHLQQMAEMQRHFWVLLHGLAVACALTIVPVGVVLGWMLTAGMHKTCSPRAGHTQLDTIRVTAGCIDPGLAKRPLSKSSAPCRSATICSILCRSLTAECAAQWCRTLLLQK